MTPEDVQKWLPIVRDLVGLIGGVIIGTAGLIRSDAALTMAGFGISATGAIGRISAGSKESE